MVTGRPASLRLEEGVDQRDVAPPDLAHRPPDASRLRTHRASSCIFQRDQLAVGGGKVEVVGPGALAAEERRRHGLEPVARRVVQHPLVGDVRAIVEHEAHRTAVAVARRGDRAAGAEDHAVRERLAVAGVVVDPLPERAVGEGDQPEHGILAGRLDRLAARLPPTSRRSRRDRRSPA